MVAAYDTDESLTISASSATELLVLVADAVLFCEVLVNVTVLAVAGLVVVTAVVELLAVVSALTVASLKAKPVVAVKSAKLDSSRYLGKRGVCIEFSP